MTRIRIIQLEPTGTKPIDIEETLGALPLEQLVEEIFQAEKGRVILQAVLHKRLVDEINKLTKIKKSIIKV